MAEMQDKKLCFITLWRLNDWGMYNRRDEVILRELSRRDEVGGVLHVEHISLRGVISMMLQWLKTTDPELRKVRGCHVRKGLTWKPICTDGNDKYFVYSVVSCYSGNKRVLKKLNSMLTCLQYRAINAFAAMKGSIVLILYPPSSFLPHAMNAIPHDLLIADLEDDLAVSNRGSAKVQRILNNYREVLPRCRWVFSNSQLMKKYSEYAGQEIALVPNAADTDMMPLYGESPRKRRNKVVGYVGAVDKSMDVDLLEHLLARFSDVKFVFIGFIREAQMNDVKKLTEKYPNVTFLGERSYRDVPSYLSDVDVLISFKKDDHTTAGVDAQKLYDYLATGKPIVSMPVPPADRFSDFIYVARNKYEFEDLLRKALEEDDRELRRRRKETAALNSWERRADIILRKVSECLR